MAFTKRYARALRAGVLAVAALAAAPALVAAPASAQSSADESRRDRYDRLIAICAEEVTSNRGATDTRDWRVRKASRFYWVFGTGDWPDSQGVRFRCRVYDERVTDVDYEVAAPGSTRGFDWVATRPRGPEPAPEPDTAEATAPAPEVPRASFTAPSEEARPSGFREAPAQGESGFAQPPAEGASAPGFKRVN